jgi:penicillin G amidase
VATRLAALLGVMLLAASLAATAWLLDPLPSRRGTVELAGLTAPVEVRFDRSGIPHVRAILENDAWRALGYLHASDRLFQMELRRRAASGRLAEVFGPAALPSDRRARTLRFRADAERDFSEAGEGERAALEAYAQGVNAFIAEQPEPLEMRALGIDPEPWTPVDSLAFAHILDEGLTMSSARERAIFDDARARGLDRAVALADASDGVATRIAPEIREVFPSLGPGPGAPPAAAGRFPAGSNAWAIDGTRSASGKPLLAGDPHLDAERPGVWYAAHLTSADGLDVAGLTLAGVPGVIIGHNGRVAWSVTMNQADDADLFLERTNAADGTVLYRGAWQPLVRTVETIHVRGAPDETLVVRESSHGPIVATLDGPPGWAFAKARAWELPGAAQGPRTFLDVDRARDGADLARAWSSFQGPPVNVVWADAAGAIGLHVFGAIPRRTHGDGRFPVPGWTADYDWDGLVPAESLPAVARPPEGYVASANDDWSATGKPLPFPGLYASSDRVVRARRLASVLRHAGVAEMRAMQSDVYSPYAARVVDALLSMKFTDPLAVRAAEILQGWDKSAALKGPGRLFFAFLSDLHDEVARPIGAGTSGAWITWSLLDRMITGDTSEALWDDPSTPRRETRVERVERALGSALARVEREDGKDPRRWSWGKVHRLAYDYPLADALPDLLAKRLRIGPVSLPGEWHTLNVAGFELSGERADVVHIPSARIIVDLGDPDASRIVLPLGQSGQMFDRHAHDLLAAWAAGRDVALPFTSGAVDAAAISLMRFIPADRP